MKITEMVSPLIVPVFTAILGAIGIWIQEWRQTRNQRFLRKQARDEAEETVEFFQKWVQAQQSLCSPQELEQVKANARKELDRVYQRLLELQEVRVHVETQPALFQRALLLYRPPGFLGWIAHILFYVLLAFFLFGILGSFTPADPGTAPETIIDIVVTNAILFIPVLIVRAWAVELKMRERARQAKNANVPALTNPTEAVRPNNA